MAPSYGEVTERHEKILIVANGSSLEGADMADVSNDVLIIAINGALSTCPNADVFFSLDPSFRVRSIVENGPRSVRYYMAVPSDYGTPGAHIASHRMPPEGNCTFLRRITGDGVLKSRKTLSEDRGSIHTGNSAWGALGLAYHMMPRKIAFLGVDATREHYAHSRESPRTTMAHMPELFASSVNQISRSGISVMNGSIDSRVLCFPRCSPGDAIEWINE